MPRLQYVLSVVVAAATAFVLGLLVRGALPTQAAMTAPRPLIVHALAKFNGPMMAFVPNSVWLTGLAETSAADAAAVKISTIRLHTHRVPNEFVYVAAGTARVQVGSMKATVGPGDFMFIPAGVPHSIQSIGAPVRLIGFESPKTPPGDIQYVK